jgi:hypothetical protein
MMNIKYLNSIIYWTSTKIVAQFGRNMQSGAKIGYFTPKFTTYFTR